jgi:hypothetical protein
MHPIKKQPIEDSIPQIVGGDDNDEDGKNDEGKGEEFNINLGDFNMQNGPKFFKMYKNLVTMSPFSVFFT